MTNHLSKKSFVIAGRVLTIVFAVLVALPFAACCGASGHRGPRHPATAPKTFAAAQMQLKAAEAAAIWNDEQQRSFNVKVSQLTTKEHLELSRQLAVLINSDKVKVDRGRLSDDLQSCPCVPGRCPPAAAAPADQLPSPATKAPAATKPAAP